MSWPVFHYELAVQASAGDELLLDGPEGRHAATVRRLRVGEAVVLTDGRGTLLESEVTKVGRREVTLSVTAANHVKPAELQLTVAQALPKGDRGELAVELMTEIGVDAIVPWQAERCVSRWEGDKLARGQAKWQIAADTAAKQSRRAWWPRVDEPSTSDVIVALAKDAHCSLVLHEEAKASLAPMVDEGAVPATGNVLVVVGPEGGISDREIGQLTAAGAVPVRLGSTVLRTSTAGVVAATLILSRSASWRSTLEP